MVSFAAILVSCALDSTTLVNHSNEIVRVEFRHINHPIYLPPNGGTASVRTVAGMTVRYSPGEWVTADHNERRHIITFDNRERFPISVRNFSNVKVRLNIIGLARTETGNPLTYYNIPARDPEISLYTGIAPDIGFIYTRTPLFEAHCVQYFPKTVTADIVIRYCGTEAFMVSIR